MKTWTEDVSAEEIHRAGTRPKPLWIQLEVYADYLEPSHTSRTETDYFKNYGKCGTFSINR